MGRGTRISRLTIVGSLVLSLACMAAGSASARPKVYRSVPTVVSFSATKGTDGAITVKATFSSPDPRCLEGKRFLQKHRDGNYWVAGGHLYFGGPFTASQEFTGHQISEPFGFDGFATPPDKGFLAPVSPAGKSPYVWQAVWPGSTEVFTTNFYNKSLPRHSSTPVSAATGVSLGATARASNGQGLPYYKIAYNQGGKHIIIKCGTLNTRDASTKIGL